MPLRNPHLPAAPLDQAAPRAAPATPPPLDSLTPAERAFACLADPAATEQQRTRAVELVARHHYKPWVSAGQRRFGLSREDAQDAAQTVLLKLMTLHPAQAIEPNAYLFCMFVHACNDIHRKYRRQIHWLWLDHPAEGDEDGPRIELAAPLQTTDPALLTHWRRVMALVDEVMLRASPKVRRVAELMVDDDYTDAEIALRLGTTESAVGDRKYRLRKMLRAIYKDVFQ